MAIGTVIGHDRQKSILLRLIERKRVPSALLFTGERGIGKMLTALNFAKALECTGSGFSDACDVCRSCLNIDGGAHPDVMIVRTEEESIKIEEIRSVIGALMYKPYEGRVKVVIIDDAEKMTIEAANAFLKTLEEPHSGTHIVLVADDPDRLPETVRSRCFHLRFSPLSREQCSRVIGKKPDDPAILYHLAYAMGRPGLVVSGDIVKERERFFDLLARIRERGTRDEWEDRAEMKQWLDMAGFLLRDLAAAALDPEAVFLFGKPRLTTGIHSLIELYHEIEAVRMTSESNPNRFITWNYLSTMVGGPAFETNREGRHA